MIPVCNDEATLAALLVLVQLHVDADLFAMRTAWYGRGYWRRVSAHATSSESEIVKLIEVEEERLMDASAAQDAMQHLINGRKPSVVEDA